MEMTKINYENTRELGRQIQNEATAYEGIYSRQIYGTFRNKLQDCFQGDDATLAIERLDALRNDFEAMKEVITQYGKQLVKVAESYEQDMNALKTTAGSLTADRK